MSRPLPTPPANRPPSRLDPYALGLFVIGVAWLRSFARYGMNWIDEGFALNAAQRIHDGEMLYRDFFSPYGPGRHYLVGWAFDLFGSNLLVARWTWILVLAGAAVVAYRVGLRLLPRPWAIAVALYFLLVPPQLYKAFTPAAYLGVALATLRAIDRPSARRWLVAGIVAGIAGWFRFEVWGAGAVLLVIAWALAPRADDAGRQGSELLAAAGGAAAAILPLGTFYAASGLVGDIVGYERMQKQQLARFFTLPLPDPLAAFAGPGSAWQRLAAAFDAVAGWVPLAVCAAALVAGVALARRGTGRAAARERGAAPTGPERNQAAALVVLGAAGLLMQIAYFSRPDFDHLLHVTPVAFLPLAFFLRRAIGSRGGVARRTLAACALVAGALFLTGFAASAIVRHPLEGFSIGRRLACRDRVELPSRAVYYDTPYQAEVTRRIAGILEFNAARAGPGRDRIGFLKFGSFWYWAFDLKSPIPQDPLSTFSGPGGDPAEEEAIVEALRRADLRLVFLETPDPHYAVLPPFETIHPLLARYLREKFRPIRMQIGEWALLEPVPGRR